MITLSQLGKATPVEQARWVRRWWIRPLLLVLMRAGVRPWVIAQALLAEAAEFERAVHAANPIRELEK